MSSEANALDVTIMGREFRVACPEEEREGLLASVRYLDQKMRAIRDGGKVVGLERIAIMAALNIVHELLSVRPPGDFDMSEFRRKIIIMQERIDHAMCDQDDLF
jgi:cell division protein ZapA